MFTTERAAVVRKEKRPCVSPTAGRASVVQPTSFVQGVRVLTLLTCALFFLSASPLVARSQEEVPPVAIPPVPQPAPYTIEGIPGGDHVVGDFVVGPGKIDLTLKPGESRVIEMTVTNRTGERRMFNLTTEDAAGSTDINTPIVLLGNDRGPYSLKDYLHFSHAHFELGQNERARVPVTISVPLDAEPGGLYGSVLVDTVAIKADSGESENTVPQSAIVARIGTLFFITVPGHVEKDGKLKKFATIPETHFLQGGPVKFGIYYENNGPIHLAPYGEIRIKNMLGEEVDFVQLEPWFVLPSSQRLREVSWNREFLFGRYVATAHINRSYDDIVDAETFVFWVLPWKIVLAAFGAIFVVVFIIRTFFRTFEFKRKSK